MLNVNSIKEISNAYIPGADLYCDLWVESYMNMKDVINYISVGPSDGGFYICDCGEYYFQVPCGVPLDISKCANCGKEIGGKNQKLVIRKEDNGEYKIMRIYSNEKNRRAVQSRPDLKRIYGYNFERGYPYKIFSKFKEEIIVKLQKEYKGISEQSFLFFITEKDIRNLNNISFRLLNFIIYSNIYFAYKCGIISLNDIKINKLVPIKENKYKGKYDGDECYYNGYRKEILDKRRDLNDKNVENAIIYILNVNWHYLKMRLEQKGVDNIKIFLNLIFNKLFDIIINSSDMSTTEKRSEFELKINNIVKEKIEEYKKKGKENYLNNIKEIYKNSDLEEEYLILDRNDKIDFIEKEYPFYYEFLNIPLIKKNDIKELLDSIKNSNKIYPVLYYYLDTNPKDIEILQTLTQVNNFVNYTITHYSNELSRKDAVDKKINEEIGKEIPERLFDEFLNAYNKYKLYNVASQYKCHNLNDKVEARELNKGDNLSCFLIDDGVQGQGMRLAALYEKYISFQNTFLNNIFDNVDKNNKKMEYLKEKISEDIISPQKANQYNIVSFNISKENYSFLEMLLFYSYKDSFDSKGNYDFSKKKQIKYNLEEIEELLEGLLLPGKKKFNDSLEFVIYKYEGFRNNNSSILISFLDKYPQIKLQDDQIKILYKFKNEQYSIDIITKILFSMQLMISYYKDKDLDNEQNIGETIKDFPNYFKIHPETKKLFFDNKFQLKHLISVYEYFELLCFSEFKKNIDPRYNSTEDISKEKKSKIDEYFAIPDDLINKTTIATTVRRFISRNLVGIREDTEIDCNNELFELIKPDCWDSDFIFNEILFDRCLEKFKKFGIKVKEALRLYEYLGGDNILLGKDIQKEIMEKEESEKEEENNRNNKKKKRKKQRQLKETF